MLVSPRPIAPSDGPWLRGPLLLFLLAAVAQGDDVRFASDWTRNGFATPVFEINGTESRNNPLRRRLEQPFDRGELFLRYRIRYAAASVDTPETDEGEFVVLWLDDAEGNDNSTHAGGVPNIGIHVAGNTNRFMVRYAARRESYAAPLVGGRDYLVVVRLWKSKANPDAPFDQLDLWVDPVPDAELKPHANVISPAAPAQIKWLGFSTGNKTEVEDRIFVWDIALATTWREILRLPTEVVKPPPAVAMTPTIDFSDHVLPILRARCFECHGGADADVRLDVHDEVLNLTKPGDAPNSRLVQLVEGGEMPPEDASELTSKEVDTLRAWVTEGLVWDEDKLPTPQPTTDHWAFQPIARPPVPEVSRSEWVRTPVDAFILSQQEKLGLSPNPPADARTLARRLSLDLRGLPPDTHEITVDELLADPAYGERWGRHWLDVARWAESNGYQHNRARPHAWRYRDWVVNAFTNDLPFDQFLRAQVAGDELSPVSPSDESRLVATGFLAAARYSGNELDKRIQRNDILVDIVNTTTGAFLGLTMRCAQCHTHKFDPISIRDYYRMQAFFAGGQPANISVSPETDRAAELVTARWKIFDDTEARLVRIRQRKGQPPLVTPKTVVAQMSAADRERFQALDRQIGELDQTWAYHAPATASRLRAVTPHEMRWPLPRNPAANASTQMLLRGDVNSPGPEVTPAWPLVFGPTPATATRRTDLADWMTAVQNPLTARVWVNRVWHWHFGRGLVETVDDFGTQGMRPSHPELLDYLASELIANHWSTNHIHRLILNSATYRQSSRSTASSQRIDPENKSWWRWMPRRLEAEAIRDVMLAVSGRLDPKLGGPSVAVESDSRRRTLYLRQHRDRLSAQQRLFDGPDSVTSCSRRRVSTNALQPLWLLNSRFSQKSASALAARAESMERAFELCLGRLPTDNERTLLNQHTMEHGLVSTCLVLLNSSEFLYIP